MANKCPKCQTNNPEDSKFCKECATPLLGIQDTLHTKTLETPTEELTRGSLFADRYEIIEELGKGGMGRVYRVEDKKIKKEIALKLIKPEIALDKKTIERFKNELTTARDIRHKNVCGMFDLAEEKGQHYITMEYVSGGDLKRFIKRAKRLDTGTAVSIAKQICGGLSEAHNLGIVHRDLKPSNIMIDDNGNARIMDFGIARTVKEKGITGSGVMIGTPAYMSPEQAEAKEVDQRSDIYSLGVILYEMVTGQLPFEGDTPLAVAMKHKGEIPRNPKEINLQIPDDLSKVILKCLGKERENRYQSAEEIRSELERLEQGLPTIKRIEPKKKPITSRDITVQFSLRKLFVPILFFITVVIIALMIWSPWANKETVPTLSIEAPNIKPFLASEEIENFPAWSPSGNLIAYVSDQNGNEDVWVCDLSGANSINLTADFQQTDTSPAWSPDGQRIAFYSMRDGGGIFTMTALGADVRKVVSVKPSVIYTFSLQWASDRSIVYTDFDRKGYKQVFRVSEDGGSPECLTRDLKGGEGAGMAGQISPSGKHLLFTSTPTGPRAKLYLVDLLSERMELISLQVSHPMWSPTGECFYYISSKEGPSDLWKQTLDERSGTPSSEPQRVTSALKIEKFTVSPDGKSILASTRRSTGTIWSFPLSLDRIQSLDVGTQLTVTQDFFDSRPRYAKQMHAIFFNSNRRGSLDIWTLSLDNKNLSRLTSDPTTERLPRPSHTGLWVAYDAETEKSSSVHLMKPDGSNIHLLESSLSQKIICRCCADWSPDDKNLIFVYNLDNGEAGLAIATMDVERGEAIDVQLLDLPGEGEEYPRWSPGGEFFVFESFYDGSWDLWIADSNGKNPYQLTSSPDNERSAAWSPDSRYIFYITPETRCLWRVPMSLAGRPSGPTELWLKPPTRFRVPYDSIDFFDGQLFTSIVEEAVDIWMVEFSKN